MHKYTQRAFRSISILANTRQLIAQLKNTQDIVHKLILTRTPNQRVALYVSPSITINELTHKIKEVFPDRTFGIATNVSSVSTVGKIVVVEEQVKEYQQCKNTLAIDALIYNKLALYQKNVDNKLTMFYGLEISELNFSNRFNIPEHVEQGIASLNAEWNDTSQTVGSAISFDNVPNISQKPSNNGTQKHQLTPLQKQAMRESIQQLISMKKFHEHKGAYLPTTNRLMNRILGYLSINWVFLFYLTYGMYGWDVGEPVSYLSGLTIDLIAMMGLFQVNRALMAQKEMDKKTVETVMNIKAYENMAKWRISYFARKIPNN